MPSLFLNNSCKPGTTVELCTVHNTTSSPDFVQPCTPAQPIRIAANKPVFGLEMACANSETRPAGTLNLALVVALRIARIHSSAKKCHDTGTMPMPGVVRILLGIPRNSSNSVSTCTHEPGYPRTILLARVFHLYPGSCGQEFLASTGSRLVLAPVGFLVVNFWFSGAATLPCPGGILGFLPRPSSIGFPTLVP
eukprot:678323-Rhodomonas_salina.1